MNELFRKRIQRRLESLPDEQAYQVLDYIEFLESKYGTGAAKPSPFQQVAEKVEDALRAGRLPAAAVRGTMDAMASASRIMSGLAAASRAAADELSKSVPAGTAESAGTPRADDAAPKGGAGGAAEGSGGPEPQGEHRSESA